MPYKTEQPIIQRLINTIAPDQLPRKLEIIQFNDVYNVDEKEDKEEAKGPAKKTDELRLKAGVARFVNAMKVYRSKYKTNENTIFIYPI